MDKKQGRGQKTSIVLARTRADEKKKLQRKGRIRGGKDPSPWNHFREVAASRDAKKTIRGRKRCEEGERLRLSRTKKQDNRQTP